MSAKLDETQIKKVFADFDVNSNGILSLAEIDKAVLELYPQFSKNKPVILRAYKAADISKDGFIDFSEFSRLIDLLYYYGELYETFKQLDENKDNRISISEFKKGHKLIGLEAKSNAEFKKEFDEIDKNRGGYILFDEFCIYAAKKKLIEKIEKKDKKETVREMTRSESTSGTSKSRPESIIGTSILDDASVTSFASDIKDVKDDHVIKSLYKLSEDLTKFLKKSEGCDVTIEIGKETDVETFHAHSPILRARSSYFYNALSKKGKLNEDTSTVSYIYSALSTFMSQTDETGEAGDVIFKKENIAPKIFKIIIDYIYGGVSGVDKVGELGSTEFLDLLDACEELGIQGFNDYLQPYFLENHVEWIQQNLLILEKFSSKRDAFHEIRSYCLDQLCQNPDVILNSDDKKSIDKNVLIAFLSRDDLVADEADLWNFVIEWGIAQNPDLSKAPVSEWPRDAEAFSTLKAIVSDLIPLIRFKWIPSDFFYKSIRPYKLIFDGDLYEDAMQFYLVSNSTSTPTTPTPTPASLIPKTTIKARAKNANLIINENGGYPVLFSCWIDRKKFKQDHQPYKFKLLYRGSTENFSYPTFHEKCSTVANTLTIAKIKDTDELIGGYNPGVWKIAGRNPNATYPISSRKTFIFKIDKSNLENSKISRVSDQFNALRHKKESGPNFCDLVILNQTTPIHYNKHFYEKDLSIEGHHLYDYEVYRVLPKF